MIPVYYPDAGRRFVMHWSTDDRRGRIAVATSEASLQHLARRIFDDSPHAEIKALLEVELVAPSRKFCAEVAKAERKRNIRAFLVDAMAHVENVVVAGKELPPLFESCRQYVVHPDELDPDDEKSVEDQVAERFESDPRHFSCRSCTCGIRLVGMTKEQFYDQYFERWCAEINQRGYGPRPVDPKQPQAVESYARRAHDDETFGAAVANYWDHSQGAHLTTPETWHGHSSDSLLFFYVKLRELDAGPYTAMLRGAREAEKAARKAHEADCVRRYADEKAAKVAKTIAFFMGGVT